MKSVMPDSISRNILSFRHPLWLVGFRPFFILTFLLGVLLPLFWVSRLANWGHWELSAFSPNQWHAHEMFYGFGWALLGGFLLTASKNWVEIRGLHGGALALAVLFWMVERAVMIFATEQGPITWVLGNMYLIYVISYLLWSLIKNRANDSFADNYLFWISLPLFLVAKNLMLHEPTYSQGVAMTTGLFRVVFVIMFERTMVQFMKNAMNTPLPRIRWLDYGIKVLMLLSVGATFLPSQWAAILLLMTALLLGFRFLIWKPLVGAQTFGVAVMYIGYLGLTLHLGLEAWSKLNGGFLGIGAVSLHMFTFFSMGMIIPSMMIRISQGHTGRKPIFLKIDRLALSLMAFGGLCRVAFTQIWPEHYLIWVGLAGLGWSLCFAILGLRFIPFLLKPRLDGREH